MERVGGECTMIIGENVIIRQLELGDEDYLYKW